MVYVLTLGNPSGARRRARCSVFNDQVAVPSRSRSGGRRNSVRIVRARLGRTAPVLPHGHASAPPRPARSG